MKTTTKLNQDAEPSAIAPVRVQPGVRRHRVRITQTVELTAAERKQLLQRARTLGYDFDSAKPQVLLKRMFEGCIKDAVATASETTY